MSLDTWIEYKSIYGNTLFIYNKATGEHKWPSEDGGSNLQDNIMHGLPIMAKEYCCIATQTDDYGCENGCSSKYINTSNVIENAGPLNNINSVSSVDVDNTTASCSNENYNNQQGSMTVSDSEDVSNETNVEKPIECSQLSQEFEVEQDLTQHEQTSCVEESIKCSYCKRMPERI
ncbi:hypothetical protein AC249_AIPGENE26618 [Exaiptasia diaphana]|nr:hypothetical protein AC249_AIPGENE26618 [Exaiptasia diaphana]